MLENCVGALRLIGFLQYGSYAEFQKASLTGDRYVIRNYPHSTLYGTRGKKEALIVAPQVIGFISDEVGAVRIVVEAKYQDGSGSVDEKLPYVWAAFLASEVPNWIAILDGRWWKSGRGEAATAWLRCQKAPADRTFWVMNQRGFIEMARKLWGAA